jgi:hypothetical protein
VKSLWKTVEKQEKQRAMCSGCAGDNEEPGFSAWKPDVRKRKKLAEKKPAGGGTKRNKSRKNRERLWIFRWRAGKRMNL